eukprot:1490090-Prymnesium_polylepis.1
MRADPAGAMSQVLVVRHSIGKKLLPGARTMYTRGPRPPPYSRHRARGTPVRRRKTAASAPPRSPAAPDL